jgi:hypothetical protein
MHVASGNQTPCRYCTHKLSVEACPVPRGLCVKQALLDIKFNLSIQPAIYMVSYWASQVRSREPSVVFSETAHRATLLISISVLLETVSGVWTLIRPSIWNAVSAPTEYVYTSRTNTMLVFSLYRWIMICLSPQTYGCVLAACTGSSVIGATMFYKHSTAKLTGS